MKRSRSNQEMKNTRYKLDISEERLHLSFPAYFLIWLEWYGKENEKYDIVDRIVVHELRFQLQKGSRNIEGQGKIRRFVWIEEKDENGSIITFGAIFDEYKTEKTSYVAYLESSTHGTSMVKPILRAYAEFISLITKGWILHIWADALKPGETYLFRNALHLPKTSEELREMYSALLKQSKFSGKNYEYQFDMPPLPQFGKKIEEDTIKLFNELQENFSEGIKKLNAQFVNTHCVNLDSRNNPLPTFIPQPFNRYKIESVPNNEDFCKDVSLDFSNKESAVESSKKLIQKLRGYGNGIYFPYDIHCLREKPHFEEYVNRALHSVYDHNIQ
ncbi:hypothetical protein HK103_004089 [Boothiomyces macroporosus]|uniref:Uncharacterized protein n=1 Tax=Boothiomyces macroporosus TaxID=261099 RepID=A0AAD5UBY6_9FUNG|nr:hypothetical protein HK103_004089 [Boothiomyces macroporosus]